MFLDLDNTIVFSRRSVAATGGARPPIVAVERLHGEESAFVHTGVRRALDRASVDAVVVPTTTRSVEQFSRLESLASRPWRLALVANGAVLLVDGRPDPDWSDRVRAVLRREPCSLVDVRGTVLSALGRAEAALIPGESVRTVADAFLHLVAVDETSARRLHDTLVAVLTDARILTAAAGSGWSATRQGRKIYLVPAVVSKGAALTAVRDRFGLTWTAASGDSVLDVDMLLAADVTIVPAHAEALKHLLAVPGAVATRRRGPAAAVEIVTHLADRLNALTAAAPLTGSGALHGRH